MMADTEYWMSQIMRENPALYELLRDFGYTKDDWDELDPVEQEDLKKTAVSCYCINHGIAPIEGGNDQNVSITSRPPVQVSAVKLW